MKTVLKPFEVLLIAVVLLNQRISLVAGLSCYQCENGVIHSSKVEVVYSILNSQPSNKFPVPPKPAPGEDLVIPGLCASYSQDDALPKPFEATMKECDSSADAGLCVVGEVKSTLPVPLAPFEFKKCLSKEEAKQLSCDSKGGNGPKICICGKENCNKVIAECKCDLTNNAADTHSSSKGKGTRIFHLDLITFIAITCVLKLLY